MTTLNLLGSLKVSRSNAIVTALGASGFLDIYTGAPPTDVSTAATGTLIVSIPLAATAGVVSGTGTVASPAVFTLSGVPLSANATGVGTLTAGYGRMRTAAQGASGPGVVDLDVGTSAASIILNSTSITNGGPVVISSGTITEA